MLSHILWKKKTVKDVKSRLNIIGWNNSRVIKRFYSSFSRFSSIYGPHNIYKRCLVGYEGDTNFFPRLMPKNTAFSNNLLLKRYNFNVVPNPTKYYPPYINIQEIERSKIYQTGRVSIRRDANKNPICQIKCGSLFYDVDSIYDLNRALHGDIVYFEIYRKRSLEAYVRSTARVVYILERTKGRPFIGKIADTIGDFLRMRQLSNPWNVAYFSKKDQILNHLDDINMVYFGDLESWPENLNGPILKLNYKRFIVYNQKMTTNASKIKDRVYYSFDRSKSLLNDLEKSELEITNDRMDLTNECVFTMDFEHAAELDNAISFKYVENGCFEIGVHISDVSHFVLPDSDIDKRASELNYSFVDTSRAYPMLPLYLSSDLCCLVPNRNRYTVSVIMTFDEAFSLVKSWIGRSVVRSCVKLSREEVSKLIESDGDSHGIKTPVYNGFSMSKLQKIIKELYKIVDKLRDNETNHQKLFLYQPSHFNLLKNLIFISSKPGKQGKKGHWWGEKFYTVANLIVARKLFENSLEGAIFRVNPLDKERMAEIVDFLKSQDLHVDVSSIETLDLSLKNILNKHGLHTACSVFYVIYSNFERTQYKILRKNEKKGKIDEEAYYNFIMNYNAFTVCHSPLKYYVNILTHRMLLDPEVFCPKTEESWQRLQYLVDLCNPGESRSLEARERNKYFDLWLNFKRNGPSISGACFIPNLGVLSDNHMRLMLHPSCVVVPFDGDQTNIMKKGYFRTFKIEIRAKDSKYSFDEMNFPFDINIL